MSTSTKSSWLCRVFGHKWEIKKFERREQIDADTTLDHYQISALPFCRRCGEQNPSYPALAATPEP